MKVLSLSTLMLCAGFFLLSSQDLEKPATISYDLEYLDNNEINVVVTIDLEMGWHVYGLTPKENGPVPATLEIYDTTAYQSVGDAFARTEAIHKMDNAFGVELEYYEDQAVFVQKVKLNEAVTELQFSFEYQVCDDWMCLKPDWLDESVVLKKNFFKPISNDKGAEAPKTDN